MVDREGDADTFLQEFMARAKKRQAKLAQINDQLTSNTKNNDDVTYPPLSPLHEENTTVESPDVDQGDDLSRVQDGGEGGSPSCSELNYSSDLSLECDTNEVYRAEPVVCHSSPEQQQQQQPPVYPARQVSPRKQMPTAPLQSQENSSVSLDRKLDQKPTSSQSLPNTSPNEETLKSLELKVNRAEQTKSQLKKMVDISKHGSKEHVEAAKLLQIAEIEHLTYMNNFTLFKQGFRKKTESLGSITITGIRLKISPKLRNDLAEDAVAHYFFCVASCGMDVRATEIITTNDIKRQDLKAHLQFKEKISFAELPPDFLVKIEVFELVVGQHIPKLLARLTPSKKSKVTPESHFKRVGSMKLTLKDREVCYKNLTHWSDHEKSKYIERECKFQMQLKTEQLPNKMGMLHVRCLDNEGRPDWSRFWVDLSNGRIKFWHSKRDALDGKKPNQVLEFEELCSHQSQKLTPDDDLYRQHSFVLYSYQQLTGGEKNTLFQRVLKDDPKFKLAKHQLAADTKEDRDSWCAILDRSLECFRQWHGTTKIYTFEEIKEIFSSSY